MMLHKGTWDSRFRRLAVDARVVRLGWFASLDPAMVLVVPPATTAAVAHTAMTAAADPANTLRAPDILAATRTAPTPDTDNGADHSMSPSTPDRHRANPGALRQIPAGRQGETPPGAQRIESAHRTAAG
jgi:hypothetical protein